jgi:serine/threonine protein kinase
MKEVSILKKMNHPSILKIYEFYECPNCYYIVTELCLGGELLNYLNSKQKLPEKEVKVILFQILSGIQYCHRKNIVHCDIKLENILLHQ